MLGVMVNRATRGACLLRVALYLFCGLVVVTPTACTGIRLTRPVLKIGLVGPFEGEYRYVGYDAFYAARLALREANAGGGVGGYSVELVAFDDRATVDAARSAARALTQDPQVIAVIGHYRNDATESARTVYDAAGLPLVVAGTVEGDTSAQAHLFCPIVEVVLPVLENNNVGAPNAHRIQWFAANGEVPACAAPVSVIVSMEVPPASSVDAVFLTQDAVVAGETHRALREAGWEGIIAGGPSLGSPLFSYVAENPAGAIFASPHRYPEVEEMDAEFAQDYQSLGPHVPPPGPFALTTYEAAQRLLHAIDATVRHGETPSRETIAKHLDQQSTTNIYFYRYGTLGRAELLGTE